MAGFSPFMGRPVQPAGSQRGPNFRVGVRGGELLLGRLSGMDEQLDFGAEAGRQRANRGPNDRLLVAGEVAAMLRVTTGWVYAQTRAGRMPCVRLGRYYRYRVAAIEAWIDEVERG